MNTQAAKFLMPVAIAAFLMSSDAKAGLWEDIAHPVGRGIAKTGESILKNPAEALPPCWGQPQNCRGEEKKTTKPAALPTQTPTFTRHYRVDCIDRSTGRNAGDNTVTMTSVVSYADAEREIANRLRSGDLCSETDSSRITRAGSGRYIN